MFRHLTLFALFLAFCVVVMGAYVRLSEAGLGCPDWPGCYGNLIVQTPSDTHMLKEHPFDSVKALKEMMHRYLAGGLGATVLVLAGLVFRIRDDARSRAMTWTYTTLFLVIVQALLGRWTVQMHIMPIVVTTHLIAGFLTVFCLYRLWLSVGNVTIENTSVQGLLWVSRFSLLALFVQIALGGWVSSHYAALSCPDFPTCTGAWWPESDYVTAFHFWKGLVDGTWELLSPEARIAIHMTHRIGSVVVFCLLTVLAFCITSNQKVPHLSRSGILLNILLLIQVCLGIAVVLLRLPLLIAIAHHAFAILLLLHVAYIHHFLLRRELLEKPAVLPESVPISETQLPPVLEVLAPVTIPLPPIEERVPVDIMPPPSAPTPEGLFARLKHQLGKTRGGLTGFLATLSVGKKAINQDLLDDIEAQLLMADMGVTATREIIEHLTENIEQHQLDDTESVKKRLKEYLYEMIRPVSQPLHIPPEIRPFVILVVGVNGVGKTTTIGKLAKRLQNKGHSVMLAAGDTFRAAAVEQLQTWGERNKVSVIAQHTGADSASVIFDAVQAAQSRGIDVLIADTAGRLHTKSNLMEELGKVKRIMNRLDVTAPHEVLLVLDAGTGQNAINQARQFNEAVGLSGMVLTKLDGTAKGGVLFALAKQFGIPIRYIGIGETIDDLQDFDAQKFIDALFEE